MCTKAPLSLTHKINKIKLYVKLGDTPARFVCQHRCSLHSPGLTKVGITYFTLKKSLKSYLLKKENSLGTGCCGFGKIRKNQ